MARVIAVQQDPAATWQLVINGGIRQDIGQVHGHLIHHDLEPRGDIIHLMDPAQDSEGWIGLFREIDDAANIPGNGYSLITYLNPDGGYHATITQSQ